MNGLELFENIITTSFLTGFLSGALIVGIAVLIMHNIGQERSQK